MKKILFVGDDNICMMAEYLASQIGFEADSAVTEETPINESMLIAMGEDKIDTRVCGCPALLQTKQKDAYGYIIALKKK